MPAFIDMMIVVHAFFGGVALFTGFGAIVSKKGSIFHKRSGSLFVISMYLSGIIALIVSLLPQHENPFLFSIGLFSLYFLTLGYRATKFKAPGATLRFETRISQLMFLVSATMISLPFFYSSSINSVLLVFGIFGIISSVLNMIQFKNIEYTKKKWLGIHLGNITGAYISATTAFMVVNQMLPGIYNWFAPSIVGAFFIFYWLRKIDRPKPKNI